jgi:hypothetical protein
MGFNRPQLREVSFNACYQAEHVRDRMSREAMNTSFTIWSLDYARAGLVSEALDKFFPFNPVLDFHCTDISMIHHGPASQTVPVRDMIPCPSTVPLVPADPKRQDFGWLVKVSMQRSLSKAADSLSHPLMYPRLKRATFHAAGM